MNSVIDQKRLDTAGIGVGEVGIFVSYIKLAIKIIPVEAWLMRQKIS